MLEFIGLSSFAFNPNSLQPNLIWYQSEIVRDFPWQQAKGRPHQSTYEREAIGRDHEHDSDLEEIRRRSYERRRRGYEYDEDDYYRSDRYEDEERYRRNRRRREILEKRKERIEEQIEELDDRYGY